MTGWLVGGGVAIVALALFAWVAMRKGRADARADMLEDQQEESDEMRKALDRAATDVAERKRLRDKFTR